VQQLVALFFRQIRGTHTQGEPGDFVDVVRKKLEVALQIRLRAFRPLLVADSPKLPAQLLDVALGI